MIKKRCKITFIVHGSTIYTSEKRFYADGEYPPLDANGKYEIGQLCYWLKKRSPKNDKVFSAPTTRSVQTAEIIANSYNQEFEIIEDLTSRREGIFAGYSPDEICKKYPTKYAEYEKNPKIFSCEGRESAEEYCNRMYNLIDKIQKQEFGKRIIIVGDSFLVRAVLSKVLEIPFSNGNIINIQTGSATQVNFYENKQVVMYTNYIPIR